jgi:hypothetical protein
MLSFALAAVLSQLAPPGCEAPWRSLGTTLESISYENDQLIVCAHNGGAWPQPTPVRRGCLALSPDGGMQPVATRPPRPADAWLQFGEDGGVLANVAGVNVRLELPPLLATSWAFSADRRRVALPLEAEQRVGVFDTATGVRLETLDPTTRASPCASDEVLFVGPSVFTAGVACDGPRAQPWRFTSGKREPGIAGAWEATQLDATSWGVVSALPTTLHRVPVGGPPKRLAVLSALDGCAADGCRPGHAPLFGITPMSRLSTDIPPLSSTGDGGVVVISASAWALVDARSGKAQVWRYPGCPK